MSLFIDRKSKEVFTINKDGRVNFVLSKESFLTITQDMKNFGDDISQTLSHFLNTIFERALSTLPVNQIIESYEHMYNAVLKTLNNEEHTSDFYDAFKTAAMIQINKNLKEYDIPKKGGVPIKFKLNSRNVGLLKDYIYHQVFSDRTLSFFIRCIFENYARLNIKEREKTCYFDLMIHLDRITKSNGLIRYKFNDKEELFAPYKILFDDKSNRHYVLGYLPRNTHRIRQLRNFNRNYKIVDNDYVLSSTEIHDIEYAYANNDLENLVGREDIKNYIVDFTNYGLEQFKHNAYGRPQTKSAEDSKRKVFSSTDKKMLSYFLKFGPNIELKEPKDSRELFKDFFKFSLEIYENVSIE
jgi:hypothetical protein